MAFAQAAAPVVGLRSPKLLSADNAVPERHIVIDTLRTAAPLLGLTAPVIATLDAMLSCLAPKRTHHTVFASNQTLTHRCNGISDRTLRRHAATLQEAGLLTRHDSPNGKRFSKHSRAEGTSLRFGFDLTPLFDRLHEIASLAAETLRARDQIAFLRLKIRAAANEALRQNPEDIAAQDTLRLLRRKLTVAECEALLAQQNPTALPHETASDAPEMTAKDGQSVRHHQNSNKEIIEEESPQAPITLQDLLTGCTEAAELSPKKIETLQDVVAHARTLAPMLGITPQCYEAAQNRLGAVRTATTVWAMMQFHSKIRSVGAYFRAVTTGAKSASFNPDHLVRQMCKRARFEA
jgi:replication initiation protein RepC